MWYATQTSDPTPYYFKDTSNIEPTFATWYPPEATWTEPEPIEVSETSWQYGMCLD